MANSPQYEKSKKALNSMFEEGLVNESTRDRHNAWVRRYSIGKDMDLSPRYIPDISEKEYEEWTEMGIYPDGVMKNIEMFSKMPMTDESGFPKMYSVDDILNSPLFNEEEWRQSEPEYIGDVIK